MKVCRHTFDADAILRDGFRDAEGAYGTANEYPSVWWEYAPS